MSGIEVGGAWRIETVGDTIVKEFQAWTGRPKCPTCAGRGDLGDVIPFEGVDPSKAWSSTTCPDCTGHPGWAT